jgi:hypothetical protein
MTSLLHLLLHNPSTLCSIISDLYLAVNFIASLELAQVSGFQQAIKGGLTESGLEFRGPAFCG